MEVTRCLADCLRVFAVRRIPCSSGTLDENVAMGLVSHSFLLPSASCGKGSSGTIAMVAALDGAFGKGGCPR